MLLCAGSMQPLAAQAAAGDARFAPAEERARQEGDKVIKRILLNGTIQRRITASPAAEPSPATPAPAPAPAAKSVPATKPAPAKAPVPPREVAVEPPPRIEARRAAPAVQQDAAEAIRESKAVEAPALPEDPSKPDPGPAVTEPAPLPQGAQPAPSSPGEDTPLMVVQEVEPDFPIAIVRRQKKGNVVMSFVVQRDGSVAQIEVVKTTNPFLNRAAIQALSQWRFQPLSRPQTATVEMGFDLAQQLAD
jgi:TonB family protein